MQSYIKISCTAFIVLLSACSSDLLNPNNDDLTPQEELEPLTVLELCTIYLSQNDNSNLCIAGYVGTGLDYSDTDLAQRCRPGAEARIWAEDLYDSMTQERVRLDLSMARNCLDSSRELRQTTAGRVLAKSD